MPIAIGTDAGRCDPPSTPREALRDTPWLAAVAAATLDLLARACGAASHAAPAACCSSRPRRRPLRCSCRAARSNCWASAARTRHWSSSSCPLDLLLPAAVLNRQPYLLRARVLDEAHLLMIQADSVP